MENDKKHNNQIVDEWDIGRRGTPIFKMIGYNKTVIYRYQYQANGDI